MLDPSLTIVEVLGIALEAERGAARFYRFFAEHVKNPLVKAKILSLSHEEDAHEVIIASIYKSLTDEDNPPTPSVSPEGLPKIQDLGDQPIKSLFELALEKENRAQSIYQAAAERAKDPSGRRMLLKLAAFERGHAEWIQGELQRIASDPAWYELQDGTTLLLEGP